MEQYNQEYVAHNLPLIVLSGLPQDQLSLKPQDNISAAGNGIRLSSDLPPLSGTTAEQLLDEFLKTDGASHAWSDNGQAERSGLIGFKIATTGRSFTLPPRKAVPPPIAPNLLDDQAPPLNMTAAIDLHSPLSPLSPTSPIFPDGLMTPLWLAKHQTRIPAVFLSFYHITSDHSQSTLQDNQIKSDINAIRDSLLRSGYKTRFAAVLVADKTFASAPELEDRLSGIRRATALDPKTALFFLPPPTSKDDLSTFVASVVAAIQPICVDYYRDLTKHCRRKKGRGTIPSPTASARGTSQSLTLHGWNVRYDFKLAVFAEFRQEMDAAQRHYESALEELFGPEGNLETTASWSPRWNDCRLLCDVIAFRILRCQMWRGMTSSASESWCNYRYRMKDLVDRRGKGTEGYGWAAWEARWAKMMAQLIEMADLPIFRPVDLSESRDGAQVMVATYAPPEKAYSAMDRLPPFQCLHHPGYWWRLVSKHILARRRKAEAIPAEDRTPLEEVSAAQAASRARTYDTYLVPQPHEEAPHSGHATYDYLLDVQSQTERAESEFASRGQVRTVHLVRLEFARELVRAERYGEALDMLRPVWDEMNWRREGWYESAREVLQLMYQCAVQLHDRHLTIEVAWEMACQVLDSPEQIDLMRNLEQAGQHGQSTLVSLDSRTRFSPVTLSFSFLSSEGFVGNSAAAQVVIKFDATQNARSIALHEMRINFGNNFRSLHIAHAEGSEDQVFSLLTDMREDHDPSHPMAKTLHYDANLTLRPGQTRVYDVSMPLREVDNFNVTSASITLSQPGATLEYLYTQPADVTSRVWLLRSGDSIISNRICRAEPSTITVLPKPPKMQIKMLDLKEQYFTNERMILEVEIANEEEEEADVKVDAKAEDEAGSLLDVSWSSDNDQASTGRDIPTLQIQKLPASKSSIHRVILPPPSDPSTLKITITTTYRLASSPDIETPFSKSLSLDVPFVSPFEANYDFGPRLHPEEYPNFFSLSGNSASITKGDRKPEGVEQSWCLTSRIASFASETLVMESTSIVVNKVTSNAVCLPEAKSDQAPITIDARGMVSASHILNTRKYSLEDRRVSALDLALSIKWRRQGSAEGQTTTTLLAIPNLAIPHAEPRVLCTVEQSGEDSDWRTIKYTVENPSMHFLSFTLTMEASDEFAFSGSKFRSISMTPMSRVAVEYSILVFEHDNEEQLTTVNGQRGRWISPVFRVMDPYFNRALRILDGGEGVMSDEGGNIGIWVAAE